MLASDDNGPQIRWNPKIMKSARTKICPVPEKLKQWLMASFAAGLLAGIAQAQSCYPPPSGIVAWWQAEGDAIDIAGTNLGTAAVNFSYAPGKVGECFEFGVVSSTGGFVGVPSSPSLVFSNGFTSEAWINFNANCSMYGTILTKGQDGYYVTNDWVMALRSGGKLSAFVNVAGNLQGLICNTAMSPGVWNHVAITYDGTHLLGYVNGVLDGATNIPGPLQTSDGPLRIGLYSAVSGFGPFFGGIDELSLYNRALSASEIQAIYNAGSAGKCMPPTAPIIYSQPTNLTVSFGSPANFSVIAGGPKPLSYQWTLNGTNVDGATGARLYLSSAQFSQAGNYSVLITNAYGSTISSNATLIVGPASPCDPAPSGIVSWWPAEGNASDNAGNNNGVLLGGLGFTNGEVGQGFWFNGPNQGVKISSSPTLDPTLNVGQGLTIEGWINPFNLSTTQVIAEWNDGLYGVELLVSAHAPGDLSVGTWKVLNGYAYQTLCFTGPGVVTSNAFQHVAFTCDRQSGQVALYYNGVLVAQGPFYSIYYAPGYSYTLYLGDSPSPGWHFAGVLDEFSLCNRALGQSEIAAIYNAGISGKCPLQAPAVILAQPTNQTVDVGGTATFSVIADGAQPLSYQWSFLNFYGSTKIVGATNATLTLFNVQTNQAGSYFVQVANVRGPINSTNAMLTVNTPPSITTQPASCTNFAGTTANFTVTVSGGLPMSYQWSFNGTNIAGATNSALALLNVQSSQAGNYAVLVSNHLGFALSSNALLTVKPVPASLPVITSFSPQSGAMGTLVNIFGLNFDPVPANNTVFFGAVQAVVSSASATNLVVNVPAGATYAPITETVGGLTAYANAPFLPTFPGNGALSSSSFGSPITISGGAQAVIIADFDGDGKPDLAATDASGDYVYVYRNVSTNGTLAFASPLVFQLPLSTVSYDIVAADLNGDGKQDLVLSGYADAGRVLVFQNFSTPGNISFGSCVSFAVGTGPVAVAVRDLDGDGKPDIVTANSYGGLSVLRNVGASGIITANSFVWVGNLGAPGETEYLAIADLDGDGRPDVVGISGFNTANPLSVFRNVSTPGNFACAAGVNFPEPTNSYKLAIGDMDGDGKLDVVFVSTSANVQTMSVYRNSSAPGNFTTNSLAPRIDFALGGQGCGVALGDLDGDGKPDVAVTQSPSKLSLFRNISTPGGFTNNSLAARLDFATGSNPYGVAIGDLDGDGRPDIVVANSGGQTLSIYRNVTPSRPFITSQPVSSTNLLHTTATFSVAAGGTSPLSYQWNFNGTNIDGATNVFLTLTNVQLNQAGNYAVLVTNAYGSLASSNAPLTVAGPPVVSGMVINADGGLTLNLATPTCFSSRIYVATNLTPPVDWQPIYTNPNGGTWQFTDTNTGSSTSKFYRLSTP